MKRRTSVLGLAFAAVLLVVPSARAQVVPEPPVLIAPPPEVVPLLQLLGPPGSVLTEPACASLGTVLGLGTIVIPGLPGTLEAQTGLPLSQLPIAGRPDLEASVNLLLFVQGSGCGLLPLAAERTVCAADDEFARQARLPELPPTGLPVNPGDFVPAPPAPAGAIVDTFRALALAGVPGAAEVAAALQQAGTCELRQRFGNIEPPPPPPTDAFPEIPLTPPSPAAIDQLASPVAPSFIAPVPPQRTDLTVDGAQSSETAVQAGQTAVLDDPLPRWLGLLAVVALALLVHRSVAPRDGGLN